MLSSTGISGPTRVQRAIPTAVEPENVRPARGRVPGLLALTISLEEAELSWREILGVPPNADTAAAHRMMTGWRCAACPRGFWCNLADTLMNHKMQRNSKRDNIIESMDYDSARRTKIGVRDKIS